MVQELVKTAAFEGKVFYINGMTTGPKEALHARNRIQVLSQAPVALHYNDTTTSSDVLNFVTSMAKGLLGIPFAWDGHKKIQVDKQHSSVTLAEKVKWFLDNNRLSSVTLIAHSQGADITYGALALLQKYRGRINVITLGAKTLIPAELGKSVLNFVQKTDAIAKSAQTFSGSSATAQVDPLENQRCQTFFCHGSNDYLSNSNVAYAISQLTKPVLYELRRVPQRFDPGLIRYRQSSAG